MFAAQQVNQALSGPTAPVGMYAAGTPPPASPMQYAAPAVPASPLVAAPDVGPGPEPRRLPAPALAQHSRDAESPTLGARESLSYYV